MLSYNAKLFNYNSMMGTLPCIVPRAVLQKIVAILSQTEIHPMPFMILMELMKDLRSEASYRLGRISFVWKLTGDYKYSCLQRYLPLLSYLESV